MPTQAVVPSGARDQHSKLQDGRATRDVKGKGRSGSAMTPSTESKQIKKMDPPAQPPAITKPQASSSNIPPLDPPEQGVSDQQMLSTAFYDSQWSQLIMRARNKGRTEAWLHDIYTRQFAFKQSQHLGMSLDGIRYLAEGVVWQMLHHFDKNMPYFPGLDPTQPWLPSIPGYRYQLYRSKIDDILELARISKRVGVEPFSLEAFRRRYMHHFDRVVHANVLHLSPEIRQYQVELYLWQDIVQDAPFPAERPQQ